MSILKNLSYRLLEFVLPRLHRSGVFFHLYLQLQRAITVPAGCTNAALLNIVLEDQGEVGVVIESISGKLLLLMPTHSCGMWAVVRFSYMRLMKPN